MADGAGSDPIRDMLVTDTDDAFGAGAPGQPAQRKGGDEVDLG